MMRRKTLAALIAASLPALAARAQSPIPEPSAHLGFAVGADRMLADWTQIESYFTALAAASPVVRLDTLGPTTQGRPFLLVTISSEENLRKVAELRRVQARLADPRGLSAEEERRLVASQPAVIVIQCSMHSNEVGATQMSLELAYRLATNDTLRAMLRDVVVLLLPSGNPDGTQMIVDWYRRGVGTPFEGGPMPWLYHHYVGHDNNRDWYMVTQQETRLVTDLLYRQWFPQVFYDMHQQGSFGMRLTVPPHVDPINPNVDPLIVRGINQIGMTMSAALESRGKTGVGDRVTYDLWWHGGARSTPTRHNMIGVLSEAASARIATPMTIDSAQLRGHERGLPQYERRVNFPNPWWGGTWRLRDIVDYDLIAAEAVISLIASQRAAYVQNFVNLGRKAIRLGETSAPYAYLIPYRQHDPSAVERLVETLRRGAVEVMAGDSAFVVSMAQPYRAHAKDLLEAQRYPRMEQYPGGPVERPYDVAGWTLPYQMGVRAIEVTDRSRIPAARAFDRPATPLCAALSAAGRGAGGRAAAGARRGDTRTYASVARALRAGSTVRLGRDAFALERAAGSASLAGTCGAAARGAVPAGTSLTRMPRIALYKPWTGEIDEGWTRWVLEQFDFPYVSVTDSMVRKGGLRDLYDVVLVPDMSLREMRDGMSASQVPPPYAGGLGEPGFAALRTFVNEGGTLVLLDRASELATRTFGAPVSLIRVPPRSDDWDRDASDDTTGRARQREPLYAPGSVLRVLVDGSQSIAFGMPDSAAVYVTNSVTFDVPAGSPARVIARYPARVDDILLSGYLQGGEAIAGKAAAVDVPMGRGRIVMFGFRPQYRGQSHGTFRMLFNAILESGASSLRR